MSSFVKLAILLAEANVLDIIDDRYEAFKETAHKGDEYPHNELVIRLNNQEYVVADVGSGEGKVDDDGIVIGAHYNKAFYDSINNSDRPRIDHVQNGEVLFDAAYKLLRFLPIECSEPLTADTTQSASLIKDEVSVLCEKWCKGDAFHTRIEPAQGAYEELFDTRLKYAQSTGALGSVQIAFRFQRPLLKGGTDPRKDSEEVSSTPILLDVTKDKSNFTKWRTAPAHIVPKAQSVDYYRSDNKPAFEVVMAHLQSMLDHAVTGGYFKHKRKIDDLSQITVESVKYYKIHKWQACVEARISEAKDLLSLKKNFNENALFVYDSAVIPAAEHSVNILKCPTPSCSKYISIHLAPENTFELLVDPNWQKTSYLPRTGITEAPAGGWARHAVGCSVCMSEKCVICGQQYYPYSKTAEVRAFYDYSAAPEKAFLASGRTDLGVIDRLKTGVDKVSDYCGCMKGIFWFYDEAFGALTGNAARTDRVLRNRDMVFVNDLTREVVAAYSPSSYSAALQNVTDLFLTGKDGVKEAPESAKAMTCGKIKVFFSDFVEKQCGDSGELGKFKKYIDVTNPKNKDFSFMDRLDAENLAAYFMANNKTSDEAKNEILEAMVEELKKYLSKFKARLSKSSSMDGRDNHILHTSVYSCSLCKICGSLYFVKTERNDAVTALPVEHETDDECDSDRKGRWTTMRGGIFYKDRKNTSTHITCRYVMTPKNEVSFDEWQNSLKKRVID